MKSKDLTALLMRGIAALELNGDLTPQDIEDLKDELEAAAKHFREAAEDPNKMGYTVENVKRTLKEVNETLTEMGWHSDRGLVYRVRERLQELENLA